MKSIIDEIGRSEALRLMEKSIVQASGENERLHLPKAVVVDGQVYRQHSDGRLELVGASFE